MRIVHAIIERESQIARDLAAKYGGLVNAGHRAPSVLGRALLLQMLCEQGSQVGEGWRFHQASGGQLTLLNDRASAPSVSLSHSGLWVAAAMTFDGLLGIDIEHVQRARDLKALANAAFGAEEASRARREGRDGFYRIWTLREAQAKACGKGLAKAADRLDRVAAGPDTGCWWARCDEADWWFGHWRPATDLSLAIAFRPLGEAAGTADRQAIDLATSPSSQ